MGGTLGDFVSWIKVHNDRWFFGGKMGLQARLEKLRRGNYPVQGTSERV